MVEQSERYCGNCAHGLKPEDHFCPNCGRPVEETTTGRVKRFYQEHELLSLGIAVIVAAAVAYGLWSIVNPHTVAQRTDFIQMVVGIVGGVTLIGGLLLNFRGQNENQRNTSEQIRLTRKAQDQNERNTLAQIEVTRRGQVTERFTKAIEQLGENEKPDVRLGGIYALKQLAEQQAQIALSRKRHARKRHSPATWRS